MKKIHFLLLLLFFSLSAINAQDRVSYGVTGGVFYGNLDVSTAGVDVTSLLTLLGEDEDALDVLDGGGYFVGFLANVRIIKDLNIQPELFYANAGGESILVLPVIVKYYFANTFNLQVGPQFDLVLDIPEEAKELVDALGFSAAVGLGYDFNKNIGVQVKYTLGVSNRLDNDVTEALKAIEPSIRTNTLQIGVVYNFK